jgi:hypothetical protein
MYRMCGIRAMQRDAAFRSDASGSCRIDFLFSDRLLATVSNKLRDTGTIRCCMSKYIQNSPVGPLLRFIPCVLRGKRGLLLFSLLIFSPPLWSHAFGQRYDLLLPLAMYLWGGAITVAVSFLIAGVFLRSNLALTSRWQWDISQSACGRLLQAPIWSFSLKLLAVVLFLLILVCGFIGPADPARNLAPIFVWIIWWVGMAYVSALLGNLWDLLNPWRILYSMYLHAFAKTDIALIAYPSSLASWPAVVLYFMFAWLELISGIAEQPLQLSWIIVIYSLITFTGMRLFGAATWLQHGEIFSIAFGLIARFGIFHGQLKPQRRLILRFPGLGLQSDQPVSLSMTMFTLLMLVTVTFDGVIETPLWFELSRTLLPLLQDFYPLGQAPTQHSLQGLILTIALILFYLLFIATYWLFCALITRLSGLRQSVTMTARSQVLSLVPIAIAYHLAHYFSYLLLAGQLIIPVTSDPFQLGWNLFATIDYQFNIALVDAGDVWYLSLFAIVIGHVCAVWIAHITALRATAGYDQSDSHAGFDGGVYHDQPVDFVATNHFLSRLVKRKFCGGLSN